MTRILRVIQLTSQIQNLRVSLCVSCGSCRSYSDKSNASLAGPTLCVTSDMLNLEKGKLDTYFEFNDLLESNPRWKQDLASSMIVYPNFINEAEEVVLMKELEPYMSRLHYEDSHWDDAIHNYRETEKSRWTKDNERIINRIRQVAFPPAVSPLKFVHILDLAATGVIKPHVDSVRFCGTTIAGLSLLSSSVMRLRHEEKKEIYCDVYLPKYSLYVMKDFARYKFTHEILGGEDSKFKNQTIMKTRRISVICRNESDQPESPTNIFESVRPLPEG